MERGHLEQIQTEKLTRLLGAIAADNPFYGRKLADASRRPQAETPPSLFALLDALPLTTKDELERDQADSPPYGSNLTFSPEQYSRVHKTSATTGRPLRWLDTPNSWSWILDCWHEVYRAAGVGARDRILFPFSFGPFLGFWSGFEAAERLGSFVVPAGGLGTIARLQLVETHGITVVVCTPTYALHMAEVAEAEGIDLASSSVRTLIVAGEPGGNVAATKERIEASWGARCSDHCGMTEVGAFGYESEASPGHLHVIESEFIVEVLKPDGTERVEDGEEGELVLTNLGRVGSPLIRYRTRDLVRWTTDSGGDGSHGRLLGGILARLDDMIIVRGNNVYPSAIEEVVRRFREVAEYRIRVVSTGALADLVVEIEPASALGGPRAADGGSSGTKGPNPAPEVGRLVEQIREGLERRLMFRVEVTAVAPGSLPRFELKGKRMIREGAEGKPAE